MSSLPTNPVSIIIPVHNKWELTRACLQSIEKHTPKGSFEIIVMDNGSMDGTRAGVESGFPEVRYLHHPTGLSFSRANNIAFKECRHQLVLFLNNDTEVTPGWLEPLVDMLLSSEEIAAVGPKLLYPDGTVQHAGVIFGHLHMGYHFGHRWQADHPEVNKVREFKALTGACLLCRAADFRIAGEFSEEYHTGYEDVDLCLKWSILRKRRLVYVPASTVVHHEGQSPGRNANVTRNEDMFLKIWSSLVEQDDLDYWLETRMPQHGVACIAAVVFAGQNPDEFNAFLEILFRISRCALPLFIVYPAGFEDRYEPFNRFAPLMSAVCDNRAEKVLGEWLPRQQRAAGFAGCMVFHDLTRLSRGWDDTLLGFPDQESVLVPPLSSRGGAGGWIRFLANLPAAYREDSVKIPGVIGATFHNVAIYNSELLQGTYYLPAAAVGACGSPRDVCRTERQCTLPLAIVPSCMAWTGKEITGGIPPIQPAAVIMTTRGINGAFEEILNRVLSCTPADTAEIVVFVWGCNRPDTAVLNRVLSNNRTIILWSSTVAETVTAVNRAACICLSPLLVILEPDLTPGQNWIRPLLNPLFESESAAATVAVVSAADTALTCGSTPPHPRCFALRRSDFLSAGGFRPAKGIPGAYTALLDGLRPARPDGVVVVSQSRFSEPVR